jgi:REP element-mobilizing transposase RayT
MGRSKPVISQTNLTGVLPVGSKARVKLKAILAPKRTHGGKPSLHKRKTMRPFSPGAPVHLVLSSKRAKGLWSLLHRKNQARVSSMVYVYAKRFQVKVYRFRNDGNELHLLVKAKEKKHLADYLRVLAGRIAVTTTGARKYVKRIGKFWDCLYWSKLVNWGTEFFQVREMLIAGQEDLTLAEWAQPSGPLSESGPP